MRFEIILFKIYLCNVKWKNFFKYTFHQQHNSLLFSYAFPSQQILKKFFQSLYIISLFQNMSVKVGVRVRPFNARESELNSKLCVDMIGPMTRLFDAQDTEKHRDFTFDYSFWSHDQFITDEKGYFQATGEKYADQRHVFEQVGLQILANAWQGYHCCLFAYGQTGAGKSYSMVGYGSNKGIVPISCQEIFNRIATNEDKNKQYEVNVSMLQIYNEKVQDLIVPMNKRAKEGLKIREHKTLGIYVEGLSKHFVDNYIDIEAKMDQGSRNRSIAATEMNATSSRAHTIISIEFRQIDNMDGKKREKLSVIYLVDLAGSEKVGKTGATGDRLKQAAGINQSLSTLGLVISKLADRSTGKKNVIIPYRDSCLTRILQNALGGNSKTLMICAISPATDNYEETLSTLRYADQAKKIQNKAVINESQTDKIIRTLNGQKEQLRLKMQEMEEKFKRIQKGLGLTEEQLDQLNSAKQQLRFNNSMMNNYTMSKSEKLKMEEQENFKSKSKVDIKLPHLSNLNEDPQLSRKINYSIDKERTKIGKRGLADPNDIEIGGMGVRNIHAIISKNGNDLFFIEPTVEGDDSGCYLNGNPITEETQLKALDRLAIGANNIFVVVIPDQKPRDHIEEKTIDWDFAQNQLYLKKQMVQKEINDEKQKKMKEQTQRILKKKEEELAELQRSLKESQELRKNIEQQNQIEKAQKERRQREEEALKLQREIQKDKKKILDTESQKAEKIRQKYFFQKQLLKTLPKCIQLNLIAKQFKRNITMSVKMLLPNSQGEEEEIDIKKRSIKVKVINRQTGYTYWWDTQKISNRYYLIKDLSEAYFENGVIPVLAEKDDPFWDPPEQCLIGRAFLTIKSLAYLFDNPVNLTIIGEDDHCGQLNVNLVPTNEEGTKNLSEEMDEEVEVQFEPEQLIDKPFYYNIIINSAIIPDNYRNIYVQYTLKTGPYKSQSFKTQEIKQKTKCPVFNYVHLHSFSNLTKQLLDYLYTARLVFRIYAQQILSQEKKEKSPPTIKQQPKLTNGTPDEKKAKTEDEKIVVSKNNPTSSPTKIGEKDITKPPLMTASTKEGGKNTSATNIGGNMSNSTKNVVSAKEIKQKESKDKTKNKEKDCLIY